MTRSAKLRQRTKQKIADIKDGKFSLPILPEPSGIDQYSSSKLNSKIHHSECSCHSCYFNGKQPIIAIYPEDSGMYPYMENAENWSDISNALVSYLQTSLSEFKTREAAESAANYIDDEIRSYLDDKMGKVDRKRMHEIEAQRYERICTTASNDTYSQAMEEADKILGKAERDEDGVGVLQFEEFVQFNGWKKLFVEYYQKTVKELQQAKADAEKFKKQVEDREAAIGHLREKIIKQEEKASKQAKELTKEIKSLEADLKRMERQNQFDNLR